MLLAYGLTKTTLSSVKLSSAVSTWWHSVELRLTSTGRCAASGKLALLCCSSLVICGSSAGWENTDSLSVPSSFNASLSLNTLELRAILEAVLWVAELRPSDSRLWLGSDSFCCGCRLTAGCDDAVTPDIFFPQQSTCSQSSRPSFPNTQKKRKMKKPCSELNIAKRIWKAVDASRTVRAPNTHVSPKRVITPMILIMSRTTASRLACSWLPILFWLCLMSTPITAINTTALKSRIAKMGAR